jgi:hypothetical protein
MSLIPRCRSRHAGGPRAQSSQAPWVKSSLSFANGNCVEMAHMPNGGVGVRDSKHPDTPVLWFTPAEWESFIGGLRNGDFDGRYRWQEC